MHPCHTCDIPSTLRCSGCSKVYYCSKKCQNELWPVHIFNCNPKKPINTAYYLARDARRDRFPEDPQTCEDYGFDRAFTAENRSKLLGLFQGLVNYHRVPPKTIHGWRLKGTLAEEIKKTFEKQPPEFRGGYYPWFLQNQWVLDRTLPPPSGNNDLIYQSILPGWRYAGGSPSATSDERKPPGPNINDPVWISAYRFCLGGILPLNRTIGCYLASACAAMSGTKWPYPDFTELHAAYESSSLIALLDSKGLQTERKKIVHLEDVLTGSPRVFKSVWYLKQIVMAQDNAMIPSVAVDYGFINCKGDNEKLALKECYKRYFQDLDGDPLKLHEAAIAGKTLECVEGVVKLNKKDHKIMRRLMKNLYPLSVF